MVIKTWIRRTFKVYYSITEGAAWIGYLATSAMVIIVLIDVIGRYFFKAPLRGSLELVEQIMILSGGFALMYATVKQGHVFVDIIINRFSKRLQTALFCINSIIGFGICIIAAYNIYLYALRQLKPYPQTTDILKFPTTPFQISLAIAMLLCGLAYLVQTFDFWVKKTDKERGGSNLT
jgi:TRAP-type transport system small permease protein